MDQLEIIQEEENSENIDNLFVPDVNSSDAEERKLARRIRIQKRIEAVARQHKGIEQLKAERAAERVTLLQKQLEKSSEVLHELFKEAEHEVTNVRVANDRREVDRREADQLRRERIHGQLREDAKISQEMFDEIAGKWGAIMDYNDPLCVYEDLQIQREKCEEVLKQKDTVIAMIKHELRQAENRFYLDQQAQNTDIRLLAKRVENQVTIMRAAHALELQYIEDVMIQERANMMENNDKRWNEMYKRRKEQELAISDFKVQQQQDFEETVTNVRVKHYERIREVKIALERDCGQLQKEFEYVKMSALINSEKMDYNYQILKKREDENIIIKGNQKRLINKLQDNINMLRRKMKDCERVNKAKVSKLCSEILTIQRSINNEKKKSKTLSLSNDKKYLDVWDLNRKTANKILKRIMGIEKLLCEQQLGITWREPHIKLLNREKLPSFKAAIRFLEARYGTSSPQIPMTIKRKKKSIALNQLATVDSGVAYRRLMNMVLEKLASNGSFLIEAGVDEIVTNTTHSEEVLVKVDSVLDALGIHIARDVNIMMHFFRPYVYCPLCAPDTLPYEDDNNLAASANSSDPIALTNGSTHTTAEGGIGAAINPMLGSAGLESTLNAREVDNAVDNIVSSVVNPKRLMGSTSEMNIVQKEGECIGRAMLLAEAEKKMAQMVDHVTVIGDNTSESCLINHPLHMNPALVMRALREFVSKVKCKSDNRDFLPSDHDLAKNTQTVSRLLNQKEVKEYWDRYKVILAARTSDLWDALSYGMKKYHGILEERHRLNVRLDKLQRQNKELTYLLQQFEEMKNSEGAERDSFDVLSAKELYPMLRKTSKK